MSAVEFTSDVDEKRAAHLVAGHDIGQRVEQEHRGTRYLVTYCECGFEFVTCPTLRSVP
jgi:hypothetical protein